ncbi:MAG: hypothetical protein IT210_11795 [Armatimonadetes bacterium]|nr:hypothetical protein [Armatimonadota bacterium]
MNIIRAGKIKAGLVYDQSKLNTERIHVAWLSPNFWNHGFRYGNVAFEYDWKSLLEGKRAYWVEAIRSYRPPACRILLTGENFDSILAPYNPSDKNGPWWHDSSEDQHFWDGDFCLELMIDHDLTVDQAQEVKFVAHHGGNPSLLQPAAK